jgi:hypothetical protein
MPEEQWPTPVEQWAWEEIRAGHIADFNVRDGREHDPLDPGQPDGWDDKRQLSPGFLRKILFENSYREEVPSEGVRIAGAWFPEPITLAHGRLDRQLWLEKCRFGGAADLRGLRVDG